MLGGCIIGRLGLVMMDLDGRLCAIERALLRRMNVMVRLPVAVRWIAGLAVAMAARRRHVVFSMGFHYLRLTFFE